MQIHSMFVQALSEIYENAEKHFKSGFIDRNNIKQKCKDLGEDRDNHDDAFLISLYALQIDSIIRYSVKSLNDYDRGKLLFVIMDDIIDENHPFLEKLKQDIVNALN